MWSVMVFSFLCVRQCVVDDVGDMGIGDRVPRRSSFTLPLHHVHLAEFPEVLGDERLREAREIYELLDCALAFSEVQHDLETRGVAKRLEYSCGVLNLHAVFHTTITPHP